MKNKSWKYVSVKSCIGTIIFCLIGVAVTLIPFCFEPMTYTYTKLPIIGDSSFITNTATLIQSAINMFAPIDIQSILELIITVLLYLYVGLLAINVVFSIILIIFRKNLLRVIFRIIGIILGIVWIVVFIAFLVLSLTTFALSVTNVANLTQAVTQNGYLFIYGATVFSLLMTFNQCKWFKKAYPKIKSGSIYQIV